MIAAVLISQPLRAQLTSGSISGTVSDSASKMRLASAIVSVTHVPTGRRVDVKTSENGRFVVPNLRPGGPYTVAARTLGYAPQQRTDIAVSLGDVTVVTFDLAQTAVQLQGTVITASNGEVGPTLERVGSTTVVDVTHLAQLPTLSRSLQDITRLAPAGNGVSFGGSNYRYNNLTIDGAVSNDAFGFSQSSGQATSTVPTGTPGGLARTQPISLDAVEAVSVKMAPFDIRVAGFTGASLNAVTRGGTNTTSGSGYAFARNGNLVGDGLSGHMQSNFKETQIGGRLGGPIVRDQAFYFLNAEVTRRMDPVLYAPGTGGARLTAAQAGQIAQATAQYAANSGYSNYDPGNVDTYSIPANSTKLFGRFDFVLNGTNSLTLRDNYVDATAGNLERGAALNKFASADFNHLSKTNSLVAELRTQVTDAASNSLLLGWSQVSDRRVPFAEFNGSNQIFPQIEIVDGSFGQLNLGSDRESAVYRQKTRTIELTDNLTWTRGIHAITLGTHNELYNVQYTFLNSYNGRWQYTSLANYLAEKPSRIRATYALGDNSLDAVLGTPGADFNVARPSAYLQDEMALSPTFNVTAGVRVDATMTSTASQRSGFHDFASVAAGATSHPFVGYSNDYGTSIRFSPRLGFRYNPRRDDSFVVRGGAGIFDGRMPFAWFAYPFLNNGIYSANVDFRPTYSATLTKVSLVADPTKQYTINSLYGLGNQFEINLIDNHFAQPEVARYNLGTDFTVIGGVKASLEGTYTKVLKDIYFMNLATPAPAGSFGGADNRPFYAATRLNGPGGTSSATDDPYSSVFLLTNTNKGYRYSATGSLDKAFEFSSRTSLELSSSYTFGESKDVANGQRNSPQSNWEYNQQVTPNVPVLTYSNFDIRHRVLASASWGYAWNGQTNTKLSLVYTGASGSPFTYVYNSDLNNDGSSNNDPIFIPQDASQIALTTNNWDALDAFIKADPYLDSHRGQYAARNGPRTPWSHRADLRLAQDLPIVRRGTTAHAMQVTLDVINFGNLLNSSWGKQYFVPNLNNQDVFSGLSLVGSRTNGVAPTFSFAPPPAGSTPYQVDDFTSRWQMQLGVRYLF